MLKIRRDNIKYKPSETKNGVTYKITYKNGRIECTCLGYITYGRCKHLTNDTKRYKIT